MKAVILAGGEDVRLQPITAGIPKCMIPMFDRPLLEHLLLLLRKHEITDVCVSLSGPMQCVKEYFSDGAWLGMHLTYRVEEIPTGTAGAVRNCRSLLDDLPFFVLYADAVCDLDLTAAVRFHRETGGEGTLLLARHPAPTEYGAVIADREGRVNQFIENTCGSHVITDTVNTGICILSPKVLDRIPEGERLDLGRDVLPALVRENVPLFACRTAGYWRDLGDCGSYLECMADALSGKVKLELGQERRKPGIWSDAPLPDGVSLVPPCWIGPEVKIGSGSLIGPHTVLGRGSRVGRRSMVQRTVVNAGQIADRVTAYGAILCPGARAEDGCVLNEGAVLGERALVRTGAVLMEGVRLWPGRAAPEGCRLTRSMTPEDRQKPLRFTDGLLRGTPGEDMIPETLLLLGGILGAEGAVGLGYSGGTAARTLAQAASCGIVAAGGEVLWHRMECAAQGGWLAQKHRLNMSLFVQQEGEQICVYLFDRSGLTLSRERQRRLEYALERAEYRRAGTQRMGTERQLEERPEDYARDVGRRGALYRTLRHAPEVAVTGKTAVDRSIRLALEELGCRVTDRWRKGIPAFSGSRGGFRLTAQDESGAMISARQLLTVVALVELENGGGRLAVPEQASAALELVAAGFGKQVLRLGRDGEPARQLYRDLPWLRDAAFAAVRLCARMGASGERLEQLNAKTPRFSVWRREIPLMSDRGEIMRRMAEGQRECTNAGAGIRLRIGNGWVQLIPLDRRSALRVVAEGPDLELAAELCDRYAEKAAQLDRKLGREYRGGPTK